MWSGLLPIGSVVLLKGAQVPLMIVGTCQVAMQELASPTRVFDYVGVSYPFGYTVPEEMLRFDGDAIETVYNVGYVNEDMLDFLPGMERVLEGLHDGSLTVADARRMFGPDSDSGQDTEDTDAQS